MAAAVGELSRRHASTSAGGELADTVAAWCADFPHRVECFGRRGKERGAEGDPATAWSRCRPGRKRILQPRVAFPWGTKHAVAKATTR